MLNNKYPEDYGWKEAKTCAHDYLVGNIKGMLSELRVSESAKILDAGCGGGYVVHNLYKCGFKNIWGFDVSESGVKIAKESFKDMQDKFEIHNAYEAKLPGIFPQKDYDLVLSIEVIEHLYSPKAYLKNIIIGLGQMVI